MATYAARNDSTMKVWCVACDAAGVKFLAGTANKKPARGNLYAFDADGTQQHILNIEAPIWGVSLSPNGIFAACTSWNGHIYLFKQESGKFELTWKTPNTLSSAGCYGVRVNDRGRVYAAIYDQGIYSVSPTLSEDSVLVATNIGLYNIAKPNGSQDQIHAGARDGSVVVVSQQEVENHNKSSANSLRQISTRPLCAVATCEGGKIIATGSFDGTVRAIAHDETPLWQYRTGGEVWSLAMSQDARLTVVGSGDHQVHLIEKDCTVGGWTELESLRKSDSPNAQESYVTAAIQMGAMQVATVLLDQPKRNTKTLLSAASLLETEPENPDYLYLAGQLYAAASGPENTTKAISLFQKCAKHPELEAQALTLAARLFSRQGKKKAAGALMRRATSTAPDHEGLRVHYDLARNYEDHGMHDKAKPLYELIASWDVNFKDAYARIDLPQEKLHEAAKARTLDYTGLTVTSLGPDAPNRKNVDDTMLPVLAARSRELHEPAQSPKTLTRALDKMLELDAFGKESSASLGFDLVMYANYEDGSLEDTVKKHLEMMNVFAVVEKLKLTTSLDIGTATCRYPRTFSKCGINTTGVDISADGYEFLQWAKINYEGDFSIENGASLPYDDESFDLVTCMMGTINHVDDHTQPEVVHNAYRVARTGAVVIFSVWESDCPFQSFLSIYSQFEKDLLFQKSVTSSEIQTLFLDVGLRDVQTIPFCHFPDRLPYELGFDKIDREQTECLMDIDTAIQSQRPNWPSQMALVVGRKN